MPVESSQYLSIVFFGNQVITALWQEIQSKVTIIARSNLRSLQEHDTLAEAVDLSLEELGKDSLKVRQVLFIVPADWTDRGEIKANRKQELQSLSKDLLLEPLGFVVIQDGLQTWQELSDGEPFSGSIIHHNEDSLQVRTSILGEIAGAFTIGKSGQANDDIAELHARLKPHLPDLDRVLFFDTSGQNDNYNQLLVLLRQQLGKPVEKLTPEQVAEISIVSGGQEMLGLSATSNTAEVPSTDQSPVDMTENDGFSQPSFVINQSQTLGSGNEPLTAEPTNQWDDNLEPVLESPPAKKRRRWKLPSFVFTPRRSRKLMIGGGIGLLLILILIGSYVGLANSYQAKIVVSLANQQLETNTTLPLALDTATSSANLEGIPAVKLTETITTMKEVPTTGKKLTGDPAKGKVTIYNKTSQTKTFTQGTKIEANNKIFSLDSDVTIASASAEETRSSRTEKFGEAEVTVTADSFGPEYNLPAKQEFKVADFGSSSYDAVNDDEFSGGSSREIQSVAQSDISSALQELEEEARTALHEKFQAQSSPDQPVLISDAIDVQGHQTSSAVGDEAKVVTVNLTVAGTAYQLQMADLTQVAQNVFSEQLAENYRFVPENVTFANERLVADGANPELELDLKAEATPEIDLETAKNQIAGEYTARSSSILGHLPGVRQVTAELKPKWLRYLFRRLPKDTNRIEIELNSDN